MSLVVTPGENSVTRNEFNAYLALIACAQKNMGKMMPYPHFERYTNKHLLRRYIIRDSISS